MTGPARLPALTPLDERVLACLSPDRSARASAIAEQVHRGIGERRRSPWPSVRARAERDAADVVGILRGLEHLGLARQRAGWWRACDEGNP